MFVLSEASPHLEPSASARDIAAADEAARLVGFQVYGMPGDFEQCGDAEGALAHAPPQPTVVPGVWIGYIPTPQRYAAVYDAALRRNMRLVNTLEQHLNAQEFDRAYPLLGDLTPESIVLSGSGAMDADILDEAVARLGLPIFVKGAVQSRKSRGWRACVAESREELAGLVRELLTLENRSRGRVVLRRLVRLRYSRTAPGLDFPLGREYRAFVYRGEVLGQGYFRVITGRATIL